MWKTCVKRKTSQDLVRRGFYSKWLLQGRKRDYWNSWRGTIAIRRTFPSQKSTSYSISNQASFFFYRLKKGQAEISRIFGGKAGQGRENDRWGLIGKRVLLWSVDSQEKPRREAHSTFLVLAQAWGQAEFRGLWER